MFILKYQEMENSSPNESSPLTSFITKKASNDANESNGEKIVLNDECGDSLWDAVLAQENMALHTKDSAEIEEVPNAIDDMQKNDTANPDTTSPV